MPDIAHWFGDDLALSSSGDLAIVDGIDLGNQRIVRRLMTAVEGYLWHLDYGAGIPQRIGDPHDLAAIEALVTSQIYLEASVSRAHPPIIKVEPILGGVFVSISYTIARTQLQTSIEFDVSL